MRFTPVLALVAGSLLTMSNSCKKEDDAQPCPGATSVKTAQVPGLTPCITEPIPNIGQSNAYVVNSTAEYQELFACTPPPVDFATHTLLAGKTRLATCGHVAGQKVAQACAGYTYTVKLEAGLCQALTNVVYCVLVPKIPSTAKVKFDVHLPLPEAKSVGLASER